MKLAKLNEIVHFIFQNTNKLRKTKPLYRNIKANSEYNSHYKMLVTLPSCFIVL